MILFLIFLTACIVGAWASNKQTVIISDEDLMERFIVLEHRNYRKQQNRHPLF